jgi:hypothetical protein
MHSTLIKTLSKTTHGQTLYCVFHTWATSYGYLFLSWIQTPKVNKDIFIPFNSLLIWRQCFHFHFFKVASRATSIVHLVLIWLKASWCKNYV